MSFSVFDFQQNTPNGGSLGFQAQPLEYAVLSIFEGLEEIYHRAPAVQAAALMANSAANTARRVDLPFSKSIVGNRPLLSSFFVSIRFHQ